MRTKYLTLTLPFVVLFSLSLKPVPPILWYPGRIDETIEIGDSIEIEASFTSQYYIESAYLFVEPRLQQFITLDRTTFSEIAPGAPNDFRITIYIPEGTKLKEYKGRILLRGALTYRPPLAVEIKVIEPLSGTLVDYTTYVGDTLNPILHPNLNVSPKLFLGLVTTDAFTGEVIGEIADTWRISADGLTYTFNLRDDIYWTDGPPVTANDVKFTFDAVATETVESPYMDVFSIIDTVSVLDEYTLEVVYNKIDCATMLRSLSFAILPSHKYASDFSDMASNPLNLAPTVTNGPFKFIEWVDDDHITLHRNELYYLGPPNIETLLIRIYTGPTAYELAYQDFLNGDLDLFSVRPQDMGTIEDGITNGQPFAIKRNLGDMYTFVAFNMGDPDSPEAGWIDLNTNGEFDEGEPPNLAQSRHPILNDPLVRQAISYSIEYSRIIDELYYGEATTLAANVMPAVEWAYNDLLVPYSLDTNMAELLLDQAGWIESEIDRIRYKDGSPLALTIITNSNNDIRVTTAEWMETQLESTGFDITLEIVEFGTLIDRVFSQQFDMAIAGWGSSGPEPDDSILWSYTNDAPGVWANWVSYFNEQVETSLYEAKSIPGCDINKRSKLYKEIQALIHEDAPYAFVYSPINNVVWNTRVRGIDPAVWSTDYNIEEWFIQP